MPKTLFQKLNNLYWDDETIDLVKEYLTTGQFPDDFSDYKKAKWTTNYANFSVVNDEIHYDDGDIHLTVIPNDEVEVTMHDIYTNPDEGYGLGIQSFYEKIRHRYLNISRKQVAIFLKKQSAYQIAKHPRPIVNKPIVANYPNDRWAIDLIDMSLYENTNRHYNWILTGIDYFSKKVMATPLRNKEDDTVLEGLEKIINEQMEDTLPHLLQSDNGSEFKNYVMKDWANHHHVKQIFTDTNTPTGNALVENFNLFLRKMIREGFIRHNSTNWVDHLQNYVNSRNDSKHTVTKRKPDDLWRRGTVFNVKTDQEIVETRAKLVEKAKKRLTSAKNFELQVGDHVRASNAKLYYTIRAIIKKGKGKNVPVKWSPEIYRVSMVIPPHLNAEFANNEYEISTLAGALVRTEVRPNQMGGAARHREGMRFFASELQKVDVNTVTNITNAQGQALNQVAVDDYNQEELDAREQERERQRQRQRERREQRREEGAGGGGAGGGGVRPPSERRRTPARSRDVRDEDEHAEVLRQRERDRLKRTRKRTTTSTIGSDTTLRWSDNES